MEIRRSLQRNDGRNSTKETPIHCKEIREVHMSGQRKAVEEAVLKVTGTYTNVLKDAQREEVVAILQKGLLNGSIPLSDAAKLKYGTPTTSMKYAKNILSNYLRKSPLLNGGTVHVPQARKNSRLETLQKLLDKGIDLSQEEKDALSNEISSLTTPPEAEDELMSLSDLPDTFKDLFSV
jgi:hypothetical protein